MKWDLYRSFKCESEAGSEVAPWCHSKTYEFEMVFEAYCNSSAQTADFSSRASRAERLEVLSGPVSAQLQDRQQVKGDVCYLKATE